MLAAFSQIVLCVLGWAFIATGPDLENYQVVAAIAFGCSVVIAAVRDR